MGSVTHKKIGLALSGGGARGFAHIGVVRALVENGIGIDLIAGTSAGSIIGGAFAAGMHPVEIAAMASRIRWRNVVRPSLTPLGLLSSAPMEAFLRRELPVTDFKDLKIPFAAVACDFEKGEPVVISDDDLVFAIRASCAVPGIFAPIVDADGRLLVDGGVVSPLPVDAVRNMGADVVIAVDLMACGATFRVRPSTGIGIMFQAAMLLLRTVSRDQHLDADILIEPAIAHLRPDDIRKRDELMTLGYEAALGQIADIKGLIGTG